MTLLPRLATLLPLLLLACAPTIERIDVTPAKLTLAVGIGDQLRATAFYTDGAQVDVTAKAAWSASNPAKAEVANGQVRALAEGSTQIIATLDGVTGFSSITVGRALAIALSIDPANGKVAKGLERSFVAIAQLTDGNTADLTHLVAWLSSDPSKARSLGGGKFEGVALGKVTVTASLDSASTSAELEVTAATVVRLEVEPRTATLAVGLKQPFTATGVLSDGTDEDVSSQVGWSSSNRTAFELGANGAPTNVGLAKAVGEATVTASLGSLEQTATVLVTPAQLTKVELSPTTAELPVGTTQAFVATGTYTDGTHHTITGDVTWASSADAVATVDETGHVRAIGEGQAEITATGPGDVKARVTVKVTPAEVVSIVVNGAVSELPKGASLALTATATYTDESERDVTPSAFWETGSAAVATVANAGSDRGRVTATGVGTTKVTAKYQNKQASFDLEVTPAVLTKLELAPATASLHLGLTKAFTVTGIYTDASRLPVTDATFTSSAETVATVSNAADSRGIVTAVGAGTATLTAEAHDLTAEATITVVPGGVRTIEVTPATASVALGATQAFTATAVYEDDTREPATALATWTSSDEEKATISNAAATHGVATAKAAGPTTIKAAWNGQEGTAVLTVLPPAVASLAISPATAQVIVGGTQAFTVEATLTDGTKRDAAAEVTWSSSADTIATIATDGVATAKAIGSATITARVGTITDTSTLQVISKSLVSIAISPLTPTVVDGRKQQLTATATYNDTTTAVVTDSTSWTSSATSKATITNSGTSGRGLITGVAAGTSTITASFSGKTATTVVTVTAAEVESLAVTPATSTLKPGLTQALVATATLSDTNTSVVTATATWTSSATTVATVSASGLVTAVNAGTATIKAVKDGKEATATVTVTSITGVAVAPTTALLATGQTKALAATATYSDASTETVTSTATWTTDAAAVATVSASGVVTAVGPGTAHVKATLAEKEGTVTITVPTLQLLEVLPATKTIKRNETLQLTANGMFDDANLTIIDVTGLATWTSGTPATATVSATGLVKGLVAGTVTITAAREGQTATAEITVSEDVFGCDLLPKINEVQIGTSSSGVAEFVEIFNPCPAGSDPFSLNGYKLIYRSENGSSDVTAWDFADGPATIAAQGFVVIAGSHSSMSAFPLKLKQTLGGNGGGVQLRGPSQTSATSADSLRYGVNATNNFVRGSSAPAPADTVAPGKSLVRVPDGAQVGATPDNSKDFKVSTKPTPGAPNRLN